MQDHTRFCKFLATYLTSHRKDPGIDNIIQKYFKKNKIKKLEIILKKKYYYGGFKKYYSGGKKYF